VPSVKNAPKIITPYLWLWNGFCCLSARRVRSGSSGQPQPIQITEIKAYVEYHQINEEVRRGLFFHVVIRLDDVYMADYWEKAKEASEKRKRQRR
jgi:hypothetical protein